LLPVDIILPIAAWQAEQNLSLFLDAKVNTILFSINNTDLKKLIQFLTLESFCVGGFCKEIDF